MTTIEMEYAISRRFDVRTHLIIPNVSWGLLNHEADVLAIRETGYCIEFEIKRSYPDYVADFSKHKWNGGLSKAIKEFWYVFPKKLWEKRKDDIMGRLPYFAGVLIISKSASQTLPGSKAEKYPIPNRKAEALTQVQMFKAAHLGTMRIWNLKRQIITLRHEKARLNQSSRGSK